MYSTFFKPLYNLLLFGIASFEIYLLQNLLFSVVVFLDKTINTSSLRPKFLRMDEAFHS